MNGDRSGVGTVAVGARAAPVRLTAAQSAHLNTLRGGAAQLVLLHHALGVSFPDRGYDRWGLGSLGVLMFFLMSGFLITHTIANRIAEQRFSFGEFAISRFSRIYTAYLPALGFVALVDQISSRAPGYAYHADYNLGTALGNLAMLQDFPLFQILRRLHVPEQPWFVASFGSGRQFWTISIEWWIYMSVGLIATILVQRRRASLMLLLLLVPASIEPLYNLVGGPGDSLTFDWALGAIACLVCRRVLTDGALRPTNIPKLRGAWAAVLVLAAVRLFYTQGRIYDPVFATLMSGVLFLPLLLRQAPGRMGWGATLWRGLGVERLSFHSYSLYLTHGSLIVLLCAVAPDWVSGRFGLLRLLLLANLVGLLFAVAFEQRHQAVRAILLRMAKRPGSKAVAAMFNA